MEIIQGKTTVAEASRSFDMSPSEIEGWVDEAKRGMENALRTKPLEVKEQYERQIKLCHRFEIPRRTVYCMPTKAEPKLQERFVIPIKAMIEENPSFGYRTVAHLLGVNKNTVQRVFQCKGWQVRKRPVGFRPRIQVVPSVAKAPNKRWATDLCRVWAGRDGWSNLALVINCHTRELLGRHLSRSGKSKTAESALEQALITPEQNGMVERVIRTLKDQCVQRHRFETLQHASQVIGDWIGFYNNQRHHQALGMRTPAEVYALAA